MKDVIRAFIAYGLASLAAATTLMSPAILSDLYRPTFPPGWWKPLAQEILLAGAVTATFAAIPAFTFVFKHWPRGGPGLLRSIIFGAVLGASLVFFILVLYFSAGLGSIGTIALSAGFVGLSGAVAGLVFWAVAVWPRRKELPPPPA